MAVKAISNIPRGKKYIHSSVSVLLLASQSLHTSHFIKAFVVCLNTLHLGHAKIKYERAGPKVS
jgi:hypothetical protein